MAHTNRTANENLPQFVDSDKPTWTGDFNQAMTLIDAAFARIQGQINDQQTQINNKVDKA